MKKWITGLAATATVCSLGATAALLAGLLNLPGYQVGTDHVWLGAAGTNGTFLTTLSGVGGGFDVSDGTYDGWCVEDNGVLPAVMGTLYDSTDPASLPAGVAGAPWDKVNYLLNNKAGTVAEIQAALWVLTYGISNGFPVTPAAQAMVDDANANGAGFMPAPGELAAVIIYTDGIQPDPNSSIQESIIEVEVPDVPGGEGCTPGFWKNDRKHGYNNWTPTGYSAGDDFDTVFGTAYFPGGLSLIDSLTPTNNGGYGKVIWHGTAALLNAASPNVNYAYTVAEVIAFVQAGDGDPLAYANEMTPCPLSRIQD